MQPARRTVCATGYQALGESAGPGASTSPVEETHFPRNSTVRRVEGEQLAPSASNPLAPSVARGGRCPTGSARGCAAPRPTRYSGRLIIDGHDTPRLPGVR